MENLHPWWSSKFDHDHNVDVHNVASGSHSGVDDDDDDDDDDDGATSNGDWVVQ